MKKYTKRRKETLVDSVTAGLSYADNVAVDLGLLEDVGVLDAVTVAAPFVLIAVTEQMRVILGRKTGKAGFGDAVQRMVKTGAAMGVGALTAAVAGPVAAIPAAVGTRMLLSRYRSKTLLALRVKERTDRLRAIRQRREESPCYGEVDRPLLAAGVNYVE